MGRKHVSQAKRLRVYERDNFECQLCGKPVPEEELTVDHIVPLSKGGSSWITNLQTAHYYCNQEKADEEPPEGEGSHYVPPGPRHNPTGATTGKKKRKTEPKYLRDRPRNFPVYQLYPYNEIPDAVFEDELKKKKKPQDE